MVGAFVQNAEKRTAVCFIKMKPFRPSFKKKWWGKGGGTGDPEKVGEEQWREKWQKWLKSVINSDGSPSKDLNDVILSVHLQTLKVLMMMMSVFETFQHSELLAPDKMSHLELVGFL